MKLLVSLCSLLFIISTSLYAQQVKIPKPKRVGNPISLFNGEDLTGWRVYGTEKWYIDEQQLVCESGPDKAYGYLGTEELYKNFEIRFEFKQEAKGNSGLFFHSSIVDTRISGWEAEIAPIGGLTGGILESYGRGWLIKPKPEKDAYLKEGKWNKMRVRVMDDRVTTWLNGKEMVRLKDKRIGEHGGVIALQIHDGGDVKMRWRNIYLQKLRRKGDTSSVQ
jgi:Domain of Unknown Function (DUF1080)